MKALPEATRQRHPAVDWRGFAGLRDLVAHQYFGIDTSQLLPSRLICNEIPSLLVAVDAETQT